MKKTALWALAALNVVLLAALAAPYIRGNPAMAQRGDGGGGKRPEIMMIPGEVIGGNSAVVYLIDTNNQRLGAMTLNVRGNGIQGVPPQDLNRIFDADGGRPANNRK